MDSTTKKHIIVERTFHAIPDYDTSVWVELHDDEFYALDLRYATEDNFMEKQIYDCPRCFLEKDTKRRLDSVAYHLAKQDYKIALFDCYRPLPFQQKLWDIKPSANYVTPPWKGSMHNRGLAIDLSIMNQEGKLLDMGTTYDFFGPRAHSTYTQLPEKVLQNRTLLRKSMEKHGFTGIRTEWWHFSNKNTRSELKEWQWDCE